MNLPTKLQLTTALLCLLNIRKVFYTKLVVSVIKENPCQNDPGRATSPVTPPLITIAVWCVTHSAAIPAAPPSCPDET